MEKIKNQQHKHKKPLKKSTRRWIIAGLTTVIVLCVLSVTAVAYILHLIGGAEHVGLNESDLGIDYETDKNITNIALFGVDQRASETARSDAIMILTVDNKHGKLKLTSLMRDQYVPIEGHGQTKLNHAYAYGGPQLAVKSLNQIYSLGIRDYVTVNFEQLVEVVDALGGVTLEISDAEAKSANSNIGEYAKVNNVTPTYFEGGGTIHCNGMQALGYARIRNVGGTGDYLRTERQRTVMNALFAKVKDANVLDYPGMIEKILPLVQTSLDKGEILSLGTNVITKGFGSIEQSRFPLNSDLVDGGGMTINGTWYINQDLEATKKHLYDYIFEDIDPEAAVSSDKAA